jgi:hypothetical protein
VADARKEPSGRITTEKRVCKPEVEVRKDVRMKHRLHL